MALRARLRVEWGTVADLTGVMPDIESIQSTGIDIENFELLCRAEREVGRT